MMDMDCESKRAVYPVRHVFGEERKTVLPYGAVSSVANDEWRNVISSMNPSA